MGETRVFSKSPLGFALMQCSLGYFVADTIACLLDKELCKDRSMLGHHIVSMIGLFLSLYCQGKFMFFVVYRFVNEYSTPFVNMFWVLRILKKQDSSLFVVNSLVMVTVFFVCRIFPLIPWHWYVFYNTMFNSPAMVLLPWYLQLWTFLTYVAYDILNMWWFSRMVRGSVKYFLKSDKTVLEKLE